MNEHGYEHLQAILERLKLTRVPERLDQLAEEAAKESWTYVEFLDRVLDAEVSARVERDVTMKTRLARFPFVLDQRSAQFLFRLVSRRYQKGSIILTSNKSYGEWGDVVLDYVLATAMLDRLLHYSTTINIRGESYRLREKRKAGVFHDLAAKPAKGNPSTSHKTQVEGQSEINSRYEGL